MQKRTKYTWTAKAALLAITIGLSYTNGLAQAKKDTDTIKKDTVNTIDKILANAKKIKKFEDIIKPDFKKTEGLLTIYSSKNYDTIYAEIRDTLSGRYLQVIQRLVKGPANKQKYSGEQIGENTIQFQRNDRDKTLDLSQLTIFARADEKDKIASAVDRSNLNPIVKRFPIAAYSKDNKGVLIDLSAYLKSSGVFGVASYGQAGPMGGGNKVTLGAFSVDTVMSYPINTEFALRTDGQGAGSTQAQSMAGLGSEGSKATVFINTSVILLPKIPMEQRYQDSRVGYFASAEYWFSDEQQKVEIRPFIDRWRLEPREEDLEKYKKGILVEPKKPIVIYIDPATPKKWVPYLAQGITDWQRAFEKAGFKNAIIGKEWPADKDATPYLNDARYSFIRYLPSEIPNAYGPNVHDPRSGEIIQTQVGWYHNVMKIVRDWYFVQASPNDPRARKPKFDDELMGQLIRFVSSHEVGHTLGLRHNFGASSSVPVEKLRDKKWVEEHGHTPSIMDYARFNYVAQPEDKISEKGIFPRINDYDDWAIEYGYRYRNTGDFEKDKEIARKMIVERASGNQRLQWNEAELGDFRDARYQTEDLGDNNMKANTYGIKNLKVVMKNLLDWSKESSSGMGTYDEMGELYNAVVTQYLRYIIHVANNLGGVEMTQKSESEKGAIYAPVSVEKHREVLAFMDEHVFTDPEWLKDENIISKVNPQTYPNVFSRVQLMTINTLMDRVVLERIMGLSRFGDKGYTLGEYFQSLHNIVWKELDSKTAKSPLRRMLQQNYVGNLEELLSFNLGETTETDVFAMATLELENLRQQIGSILPQVTDMTSRAHFTMLKKRLDNIGKVNRGSGEI